MIEYEVQIILEQNNVYSMLSCVYIYIAVGLPIIQKCLGFQ